MDREGDAVTLLADVKPATIRTPAGTFGNTRVFVWPDRVEVWASEKGTPVLRLSASLTSIDTGKSPQAPARSKPWTLLTDTGEQWRVERGCGCSGGIPADLARMAVPQRVDA